MYNVVLAQAHRPRSPGTWRRTLFSSRLVHTFHHIIWWKLLLFFNKGDGIPLLQKTPVIWNFIHFIYIFELFTWIYVRVWRVFFFLFLLKVLIILFRFTLMDLWPPRATQGQQSNKPKGISICQMERLGLDDETLFSYEVFHLITVLLS